MTGITLSSQPGDQGDQFALPVGAGLAEDRLQMRARRLMRDFHPLRGLLERFAVGEIQGDFRFRSRQAECLAKHGELLGLAFVDA